jgi:hypothetical protein
MQGMKVENGHDYQQLCASLERDLEARTKDLDGQSKDDWMKKCAILRNMIESLPADSQDLLVRGLSETKHLSFFEGGVLDELIGALLANRDRARLVSLLAGRPVRMRYSTRAIELALALDEDNPDAILVIEESYRKSTSPEVKKSLVEVYAGAFPVIRRQFADDFAFMEAVGEWYRTNKSRLTINYDYFQYGGPTTDEDRELGIHHTPMDLYILQPPLVVGVDLRELVSATFGGDTKIINRQVLPQGVAFNLERNRKVVSNVTIGVFANKEAARLAMDAVVGKVALEPTGELDGKIGDGKVMVWLTGEVGRRILWTRDNMLVDLTVRGVQLDMPQVLQLDKDIVEGLGGLRRGDGVPVPEILDVSVPKDAKTGEETFLTVRVRLPAETVGGKQLTGTNGEQLRVADADAPSATVAPQTVQVVETEVTYKFPYRLSKAKTDIVITYATTGCVIASKKVALPANGQ